MYFEGKHFAWEDYEAKKTVGLMCGICGILDISGKGIDIKDLFAMNKCLSHRGPDGEGHWVNVDMLLGFGHRRLSIIDLSEKGVQPMHYANGSFTITFNGEIYNYLELREGLQQKGHHFHSDTDTEVVLAMYSEYGKECLQYLDGMFAFALWDEKKNELFCARDRVGEKPFYYAIHNGQFVFASEIKALWEYGLPKRVSEETVFRYLMFGVTSTSEQNTDTFYLGINKLPPAHQLSIYPDGNQKIESYWDIDNAPHHIDFEEAVEKFHELLKDSVKMRLRSDVEVGTSLSGGLDSSSIVYLMSKQLESKAARVNTFTIRYPGFDKDEGKFVDRIEKDIAINRYDVSPTTEEIIDQFETLQDYQDEPFGSFSISSQNRIYKRAKESGVSVLLDGQGADELLAGYTTGRSAYYSELKKSSKEKYKKELNAYKERYGFAYEEKGLRQKALDLIPISNSSIRKGVQNLRRDRSSYFLGIAQDVVKKYKHIENPLNRPISFREGLKFSIQQKGLGELLRYADRNSMQHSVEVRLPFLSHQLIEFVFSLPDEFLIKDAWTKYILRASMDNILPESICWRKDKIGFAAPEKELFSESFFRDLVQSSTLELKSMGLIDRTDPMLEWRYVMLAHYLK